MKSRLVQPTKVHKKFYMEFALLLQRFEVEDKMTADEMLAMAAYGVGALIALQDPKKMTPQRAMAIVTENIQEGNAQTMAQTRNKLI